MLESEGRPNCDKLATIVDVKWSATETRVWEVATVKVMRTSLKTQMNGAADNYLVVDNKLR